MKIFYVTLNTVEEATLISQDLLQNQLAVCTNWFPIQCAYRLEGEIKMDNEVVLIIKTKSNMRAHLEKVIKSHLNYNNFIAELEVNSVNDSFANWLDNEIPSYLS